MTSINVATKLRGCCSVESSRYSMSGVMATPNGSDAVYLTATTGRVAAVVRAPIESGSGTLESASLISRDILPNRITGGTLVFNGDNWHEVRSAKTADAGDADCFPPVAGVLPDVTASGRYGLSITINAEYLLDVARAVGRAGSGDGPGPIVTLLVDVQKGTTKRAIAVYGSADRIGVIMPVCNEESDRAKFATLVGEYGKAIDASGGRR